MGSEYQDGAAKSEHGYSSVRAVIVMNIKEEPDIMNSISDGTMRHYSAPPLQENDF